ncbi:hypothetical protein C5Y96_18655 [Blastopirellula marina]|uniref:Uncharacterized protein n=1 Tax=Blastopirellula marina TaxID=124 RepID=A0A2S8F5Z6_9BACT|nr:hypothetical protein C5Y96_18655 [Blastopirellula marina]RCS48087.1 hypothetical protein DTL36_18680 [Bremerella cremea]
MLYYAREHVLPCDRFGMADYLNVGMPAGTTRFIYFLKMLIQLNLSGFDVFWWQYLQAGNRIRIQTGR